MTRKEKAIKLVERFQGKGYMEFGNNVFGKTKIDFCSFTVAKQSALICLERERLFLEYFKDTSPHTYIGLVYENEELKKEIEKL